LQKGDKKYRVRTFYRGLRVRGIFFSVFSSSVILSNLTKRLEARWSLETCGTNESLLGKKVY
jgi:hypothetical protein